VTPPDAPDDATLLAAIAAPWGPAGRLAMGQLYDRQAAHVRGFLLRLDPLRPGRVDDCVQEAFVIALEHAARFEGQSARAWLLSIAARRLADRSRAENRRHRRERDHAAAARESRDRTRAPATHVEAALERLTARDRAVLELRFVQGLTHAEAADVLGVSIRTAKSWASAALDALKLAMEAGVDP